MTDHWDSDSGQTDVTSAFKGFSQPITELYDDIHRRGWTVTDVKIKDGQYVAEGKSLHGEKVTAAGRTDATAVGNLLMKVMRKEYMRASSLREKLGAWDHKPIENQLMWIAQAYQEAPVYDPAAASAWMELAQDCSRRVATIRTQLAIEYTDDPVPYQSADELREDIQKNHHVVVTRANSHHPVWNEQQVLDYRTVVDVLGHTVGGADWGWHGTCLAFAALAPLLAEFPQKALFTELIGQTAYGAVYRQWGAQKISFLDDLIEKAQQEQNKPGHSGVHPSQSLIPGQIPHIQTFSMAERSGEPALDAAIYEFMSEHRGELGNVQDFRHPMVAHGQCETVANECAAFLNQKGFNAHAEADELGAFDGYQNAQRSEDVGAGDFTYPEHCVVSIYNENSVPWWTIDFTAAQYGFDEFPKVEPGPEGPLVGPQQQSFTSAVQAQQVDPNADWQSNVQPLPDNAYMWQRADGQDPLHIQGAQEALRGLEPGLTHMHPALAQQTVVNALRASLLGARKSPMAHAVHYQGVMHIPSSVGDPMAYRDALEQQREQWNQTQGYAPESHKQYWPEEQQFKQWVKGMNPGMDDGEVNREAKREMLHMLTDEEERLTSQDQPEQLTAEQVEHEAYEAIRRRLKAMTKPSVDQKVDFGDAGMWHQASPMRAGDLHSYIAENGPWAYRMESKPEIRDAVLGNPQGILPWDHPDNTTGSLYQGDYLEPRPGHVYFSTNPLYRNPSFSAPGYDQAVWEKMMREKGLVIDLRKLDPNRFNPDEDWWSRQRYSPEGLAPPHPSTPPLGQQAEAAGLGDDPDHTHQALQSDAIAYRGNIPPEALTRYDEWANQRTATHHADMYPSYLVSHLKPLAHVSRHAKHLAEAAQEDLTDHKGHGHHFRSEAMGLGIPGLTPRHISNAWLHLAPQTSQLGIIDPHVMETLGHDWLSDGSNRDYFKHERELAAGRDASGYNHVPLGQFSSALWDNKVGGLDWHPDHSSTKAYMPTPYAQVDWNTQTPQAQDWTDPYWWNSTQEARDGVAQDFDRGIGVNYNRNDVPWGTKYAMLRDDQGNLVPVYQLKPGERALPMNQRYPWMTDPGTGEVIKGEPGMSLMTHVKQTMGHPTVQDVWAQDYEAGKEAA